MTALFMQKTWDHNNDGARDHANDGAIEQKWKPDQFETHCDTMRLSSSYSPKYSWK